MIHKEFSVSKEKGDLRYVKAVIKKAQKRTMYKFPIKYPKKTSTVKKSSDKFLKKLVSKFMLPESFSKIV